MSPTSYQLLHPASRLLPYIEKFYGYVKGRTAFSAKISEKTQFLTGYTNFFKMCLLETK